MVYKINKVEYRDEISFSRSELVFSLTMRSQ